MTAFWILCLATFAGLSARWNWWRLPKRGVPILMYHKVGTPPPNSQLKKLWVSPTMFRRQMEYLRSNGYTPIIFRDLYVHWDEKKPLPAKPILITFDDGYANNYLEAYPILKEFGFPATLFVVVNTVAGENKWHDPKSETRIPMVTWDQVRELKAAGWEIGSHTLNHRNLLKIPIEEVALEVRESRRELAVELGNNIPPTFAYPYGAGEDSPPVIEQVKESGYRLAVGVHAGKWVLEKFLEKPFQLPRIFVRGGESLFDFHLQLTRGQSRL